MTAFEILRTRLKQLRKRHGLTQEEIADLSGLNYKHYQSIESGRKKQIWLETIERIAEAYNLQPCEILDPENSGESVVRERPAPSRYHNTKRSDSEAS